MTEEAKGKELYMLTKVSVLPFMFLIGWAIWLCEIVKDLAYAFIFLTSIFYVLASGFH